MHKQKRLPIILPYMAKAKPGRSRSRSSKPAPTKRKPQPKPQPVLNEVLNEMAIKMGALADRIDRLERVYGGGAKEPLPPSNKEEPVEAMTGQLKIKSRFEEQMFYLRGICVDILGTQITNCLLLFFKHNRYNPEAFDEYFKLKSELESAVKEINDTEIIERGIEITGHAMVISRRMTDIFTNQISYK